MWLLVVIIFVAISGLYKLISDLHTEHKRRDEAIRNGEKYYFDRNWNKTDVETGISYYYKSWDSKDSKRPDKKGDMYMVNAYTGKVMRNMTQELRDRLAAEAQQRKEAAIAAGEKYYVCEYPSKWDGGGTMYDRFMNYKYREIPEAPAMFEDIETNERFLICGIYPYEYDKWMKKYDYSNNLIGMGMWNVRERKFTRMYDEEDMPEANKMECKRITDGYNKGGMGNDVCFKTRHLRWVDTLEHEPFYNVDGGKKHEWPHA